MRMNHCIVKRNLYAGTNLLNIRYIEENIRIPSSFKFISRVGQWLQLLRNQTKPNEFRVDQEFFRLIPKDSPILANSKSQNAKKQ